MANLRLNFACGPYDRTQALRDGTVRPEGVELNYLTLQPAEIFWRMLQFKEFDASEMSASEYITRHVAQKSAFVALPVFPSRMFRHGFITVDSRVIRKPKDLEGKKIGVQLYTMTAAIWIRGLLQRDQNVDLSRVQWIEGAIESPRPHGKPTVLPPLKPVSITQNTSGKSLSQLLEDGEIQAIIGADLPTGLGKVPHVQRLFPDFKEAEKAYFRRTGIFPIMHLVVMRRDFHEKYPFVATSLCNAFSESKALAYKRMRYLGALRYMLPWLPSELDEINEVFGGDPWPYGIEPNRKTLDALVQFLVDQSMIERAVPVDELFVPVRSHNWNRDTGH